ncbi:hypothetical protein [Halalkalicoccus sp. NIPERK01]|uniref:hypothetical protein n=1 Tax=Halalkalicoccus sp. NIPERK01 TaxID=3053469 RepID=UPI00256EE008|nr:hypothetical protein [Halalkalicoccus sp. NIPERK01]MDL5363358.1 hypothetical protein [Halalkalicoccus sp. NIPERK01]
MVDERGGREETVREQGELTMTPEKLTQLLDLLGELETDIDQVRTSLKRAKERNDEDIQEISNARGMFSTPYSSRAIVQGGRAEDGVIAIRYFIDEVYDINRDDSATP